MILPMDRRNFLATSAVLAVSAAVPKMAFGLAVEDDVFTEAGLGAYRQGLMSEAAFKSELGTLFMVFLPGGRVSYMTLKSVAPYVAPKSMIDGRLMGRVPRPGAKAPVTESFTAVFSTDEAGIPQGSYLVDHGRMGRVALFLVPGPKVAGQMTCRATFNYLLTMPAGPVPTPVRAVRQQVQ